MRAPWRLATALVLAGLASGCGASASRTPASGISASRLEQTRPVGAGMRFAPPITGRVLGRCEPPLGARSAVHVELFAANRVVIVAGGIGARAPLTLSAERVIRARCYGELVTLEPTGVVLVRPGRRLALATLFRSWGQALSRTQLGSFRAPRGMHVSVFVDGRRWHGAPGSVPLRRHAEIVLEVGPYVPPHTSYAFPPAA